MESTPSPASKKDLSLEEVIAFVSKVKYTTNAQLSKIFKNQDSLTVLSDRSVAAIKNELNRLRSECDRSIDLRYKVDGLSIEKVVVAKITHFLDASSLRLLNEEIARYQGHYTVGAYEHVKRVFEQQKERLLAQQELSEQEIKLVRFGRMFERSEERMNLAVCATVHLLNLQHIDEDYVPPVTDDDDPISVVTSNISHSGIKIKTDTELFVGDYVALTFDDIEKELVFRQKRITYVVNHCRFNKKLNKFEVILTIAPTHANKEFQQYVNNLIYSHKHKYKVDLAAIVESVLTKSYEQMHVSCSDTLFLLYQSNQQLQTVYGSPRSRALYEKFSVLQQNVLAEVVRHNNLFSRLKQQTSVLVFFAKAKRPNSNTPALLSGVIDDSAAAKAALKRLSDAKHVVFCRVTAGQFNPKDANKTSTVPLDAQKDYGTEQIYRTAERARELVAKLETVFTFTPVLQNDSVKLFTAADAGEWDSRYIMNPAKSSPAEIGFVSADVSDLRIEDRYLINFKINLEANGKTVSGVTKNLSSCGLLVALSDAVDVRVGSKVIINFVELAERNTVYRLSHCVYEVVGGDAKRLHLTNKNQSKHDAREFFSTLIKTRIDELKVSGDETKIHGLSHLIRNGTSKHTPNCQLFTRMHKNILAISAINLCAKQFAFTHPDHDINEDTKQWFYQSDVSEAILQAMQTCIKESVSTSMLLLLSVEGEKRDAQIKSSKVFEAGKVTVSEWQNAVRVAQFKQRQARVYELHIKEPGPEFMRFYRDELKYVKRFAPHRFDQLREQCKVVSGCIEVIEITDALLPASA